MSSRFDLLTFLTGIADDLNAAGVTCFGPSARAACLESSKAYSKAFMDRHGIPTARWKAFECPDEACAYIRRFVRKQKGRDGVRLRTMDS